MRGERAPELVSPRGRALAATGGATTWSSRPLFEAQPLEGADSYRVLVWQTAGGALDVEGKLVLKLEGPLPTLSHDGTLEPGSYTWEAWARKDGLERHRGSLDFEIVESQDLSARLTELEGMAAVELLDAAGHFADARRVARELDSDAGRDYLSQD